MSYPNNATGQRRPPCANGGFTLLELLIAIILLSTVMVLLYGSIAQISSGTDKLNANLAKQQETRLLLRMISDDLQAANYFQEFAKGNAVKSGLILSKSYVGAKDFSKVQFHANVPVRFHRRVNRQADPLIHELAYWVEASEEDPDLMLLKRREDFYLDNDMEEGGITVEISEGIQTFRIEVLAQAELSRSLDGNWLDDWDSNQDQSRRMPRAIRVTLALVAASGNKAREETLEINIESGAGEKKKPSGTGDQQ